MNTFCTIITKNYLPYAIALYKSLRRFSKDVQLQVLIVDGNIAGNELTCYHGITVFTTEQLMNFHVAASLYKKYAHTSVNNFRWSMKPVFMLYLLEHGYDKVLFTDCDIFFYNDFQFLFDELDTSSILLTPHWRTSDPLEDEPAFLSLFRDGLYNAGFVGSNKKGMPALDWWAQACHYRMETNEALGLKEDQPYLNVLPVEFTDVHIIRHKGCNVASWNHYECKRVQVGDKVLINGIYPIIFIHFNKLQFTQTLKGHDALLLPHLQEFKNTFEENGAQLSSFQKELPYYLQAGRLLKIKWTLMIRTRIKRFLFRAAEKL